MTMTGLFTEPLIPGFFPDPTVCTDGTHYYLANSSFEYFPGVPLWRSADFVSWEQVGNILTRRSQFARGDGRRSGGIFGSTLRFHDGRFWFITTNMSDFGTGHTIVSATDPAGEWSEPVFVSGAIGIDPDLVWTDDGQCLLTWCGFGYGDDSAIVQAAIDLETGALLEEPRILWTGTGLAFTEGPHLIKRDRHWYLMVAEGGTDRGHVVSVARSDEPTGPFRSHPRNPIASHRSTPSSTQSIGHADLVEGPDGQWRAVLLGTRPRGTTPGFHVLGRETFGADVTWADDWPVLEPMHPTPTPGGFEERFAGPLLSPRWVAPGADPKEIVVPGDGRLHLRGGAPPLCTRVTDLEWDAVAESAVDDDVRLSLRIDEDHFYAIELDGGVVGARAKIGSIEQTFASMRVAGNASSVHLGISSRPPARLGELGRNLGPDEICLTVRIGEETHILATVDGRYLSTEVAAGFTGRMLCLEALAEDVPAPTFSYTAATP